MMLCKQTLMCFEDSNVSQEERKEKVSKTGMGKGKREGGGVNVKWEENLVFYRTGVKFRNGPHPSNATLSQIKVHVYSLTVRHLYI